MAPRNNRKNNAATDDEKLQMKQLFELDFILAAKKNAHGVFNDPTITMEDIVLLLIRRGMIFPKEMAEMIGVTNARISILLSALSDKGYLVRKPAAFDRRKVICSLTEDGKLNANKVYRKWQQNILDAIRAVDDERFAEMMLVFIKHRLDREGGVLYER